ncbi:class C sortase [Ruminococcus sp.]|uniref:class C sortase n=1 Tax=Ruminococcus sp. TaxID=41978 RepID=UPI002E7A2EE7|nr:class C sortase [Ruminococcus sp.]MEE1262583.1 class C sortase [Ruminococcus sp.]
MKILKILFFIAMIAFGLFSVGCFLYPTISNQINEHYNESTINEYNRNVNTSSYSEIHAELQMAAQYNKVIATDFFDGGNEEYEKILNDYFDILDVDGGIMGTIEIPSIKVKLPVYHGESEDVLKKGAAHLEKTSFPIGGIDTRACVSAHSGYPSQKFFDDIDELISDDIIYIRILNQKLTYKVFDKEVVEPDDITKLKVEHGKELLTLITCYPYGINSHRLLVHAKRVYTSGNAATADEIQIHTNTKRMSAIPIIGAVIALSVISFSIGIVIHKRRKCDKSKHRQEGIKNA